MRILSLLLPLILSAAAAYSAESAGLQRGRYTGLDAAGRPCELFLVTDFGSDLVRRYRLTLASSSSFAFLNAKPALPSRGLSPVRKT
jgi:hypothetical protein